MFYNHVKKAWKNGDVQIDIWAKETYGDLAFEARGFSWLACLLLSNQEKRKLMELVQADVQEKREQKEKALKESIRKEFPSLPEQANPMLIKLALEECKSYYSQYGFKRLYLIGSRARGDARLDSDHDFVVVVSDTAPDEVVRDNGRYGYLGICRIRGSVSAVNSGAKGPDVFIFRLSDFLANKDIQSRAPYYAEHHGYRIH
ncbi:MULTISPECIES: nucleotidyltransferase domain-containing protein [Pseudoalteromonas]|uniref:nucleotidyltransferase domain-containing protein n=1 Tax=Pseudoalteromonas TaxID=53246 RepID=UPI001C658123|nr:MULTISPECIES: nucleotidyltransferase domain-containing protein [Pseudoalteromonas]MDI4653096.1 nucleotidyltransferase domain-containing protein [Pseudoalteromonas shioyasakiensis]